MADRPLIAARVALVALGLALAGCPQDVQSLPNDDPDAGVAVPDAGRTTPDAGSLGICGDGTKDPGELCDGTDLGGATCETVGVGGGTLACTGECSQFDLSGCQACTPACGARVCGLDPVCNSSCGTCDLMEACSTDGQCLASCQRGTYICTGDGTGYQACGHNDVLGVLDHGPRIACAGGEACQAGRSQPCERTQCVPGDLIIVADRSSGIALNSVWSWMRTSLNDFISDRDHGSRFGLRQFPDGPCAAGAVVPVAVDAAEALAAQFSAPGAEPSVPITAALTGLEASFTPGRDAQAVLLLTAGDETCAATGEAAKQASRLYRAGVRVYVVALTAQANRAALDAIAHAGGTEVARPAADALELEAVLEDVFADLGACANRKASVATGWYHACRLRADETIDCWGRDYDMRLVPPSGQHLQLAAGTDNACAVGVDNQVRCWGRNKRGQSTPPGGDFVHVAGGDSHFCGLKLDRTAACWGYDDAGQASPPAGTFKQVTAGAFHGCGIRPDDTVVCWGNRPTPQGTYRQIDGGGFRTCGIKTDGTLGCTGSDVLPSGTFVDISVGGDHGCAIRTDGTMACWGLNHVEQAEPPPGQFVGVSVNNEYSCGVRPDDTLECWGYGGDGQASPPP